MAVMARTVKDRERRRDGQCNPPSKYRRAWRREYRVKSNRRLAGGDDLYYPSNKVTSISDWY